jgi:hypothetical protein
MAAKTFEQWWNENWEGLDGYDREGYAQAAWDAATELAEEKFNDLTTGNNTLKTPPQGEITPSCETCLIRRSICPHSSGSEGCRSIYKSA